jgi:hypothetical protein
MSSQISAKTLKGEKKQNHHNSKNIVLHSNKNYYVPNSSSHLDSKIINRKLNSTKTPNSSVSCIAETIFSESRGEPLLGQIAVGTTIVTRTKILNKNPCLVIRGQYTQKRIPSKDKDEFYTLASNVLDGKTKNSIGNSDSFDSFKHKKHPKGSIHIGKHFFYKALHS